MIISDKYKLLYLAPPKTGTISILDKIENKPPFNGRRQDNKYSHHNTIWRRRFWGYYIFITVRNPYTRMLSLWRFAVDQVKRYLTGKPHDRWVDWWYQTLKRHDVTFQDFVHWPAYCDQMRTIWRCSWHLERIPRPVDKVVHQETYCEDLASIPMFKGIKFGRENVGPLKEKPWYEYFTDDIIHTVNEVWGQDFDRFGYSRNFDECVAGKFKCG